MLFRSSGGGGGGMNWEIGIDTYTLMCIKCMTNKNLLYKKIKLKKKSYDAGSLEDGRMRRKTQSLTCPRNHLPCRLGLSFIFSQAREGDSSQVVVPGEPNERG